MRVTQSMLSNNMLRNLSNSYNRLGKLQEQIASQKKFTKPSDDPVAAMRGLGYRTDLNRIEQYQRNIGEVKNWIDTTDSTLDKAGLALQKIRELTVQASNGSLEENQRSYIATEIEQLKEHLIDLGDTQIGGKYIFNGTKTDKKPSDLNFSNAVGTIEIEVFSGIKLQVNTEGKNLFADFTDPNGDIQKLIDDLKSPSADPTVLTNYIGKIDKQLDKFLTERANIGARQNRVDLMGDRLQQQEVFSTRILSNNEDLDVERAITELTTQESVHRAALGIGARIIQPSLMDFLR
jgi:flagellar hook-associated protein 3 FlgL